MGQAISAHNDFQGMGWIFQNDLGGLGDFDRSTVIHCCDNGQPSLWLLILWNQQVSKLLIVQLQKGTAQQKFSFWVLFDVVKDVLEGKGHDAIHLFIPQHGIRLAS